MRVLPAEDAPALVDESAYIADTVGVPPRLVRTGVIWPQPRRAANGIEIDFTAGFGLSASDVPPPVRQALMLLIAHWHERREPIEVGALDTAVPGPVSDLLEPYRMRRL